MNRAPEPVDAAAGAKWRNAIRPESEAEDPANSLSGLLSSAIWAALRPFRPDQDTAVSPDGLPAAVVQQDFARPRLRKSPGCPLSAGHDCLSVAFSM
jgi:hypothetical protein